MYGTGVVVLALLDKQFVRLLVLLCACVLEFEEANYRCSKWYEANYWRSIQYDVVSNLTLMRYFVVETNCNNDDDGLALI